MPDLECSWTPSFALIRAASDEGLFWLEQNLCEDPAAALLAIPVDFRTLEDIVLGARADGLVVVSVCDAPE